jgi:5-methylcytosine-specific restriction protein A
MGILKTISDLIKGKTSLGESRSSKWPSVRAKYLKANPSCACCGSTKNIEVHHIVPFNVDYKKELDPTNLITLCECGENGIVCHLNVGHNGSYKSWNTNVILDAKYIFIRIGNRP